MNCIRKKNTIRLKQLLRKLCQFALDELLEDVLEKRVWTRPWLLRRNERGSSALLLKELCNNDIGEYKSILRMTPDMFDILLSLVTPKIQGMDTIMRQALPARIKLEITLDFLSSGISYRRLSHFYRVSRCAIGKFIPEVCVEIYKVLEENIKIPTNFEEWAEIENGFRNRWNFPFCYGAIDGKHIQILAPGNSGTIYFNYKKVFSIVLMAIVDYDYCFRYIDVGACGMSSDGGVFKNCSIYNKLENNLLPNGGVIVTDAAFPLKSYILKPYPGDNLTLPQKVFNYRLSRARRVVENAFGILASRFRVFQKPIAANVDTVDKIVLAACALHNWLRKENRNTYLTSSDVDHEDIETGNSPLGSWRTDTEGLQSICHQGSNHSSISAIQKRETFKNYFNNKGAVPWQSRMIR
nr:protein ALP1-like isoform X1 [Onthophagus taurus]